MAEPRRRPSRQAHQARERRRSWAAAGGSHDRLIGIARVVLPTTVGVLAGLLAAAPLLGGRDISFVLSKDQVAVATERLRVSDAVYRGQDANGQPFRLTAISAIQQSSSDPTVRMRDLSAAIELNDGPATFVAPRGRYNMDTNLVSVDGPVAFKGPNGYRIDTHDVVVDLKTRIAVSGAPVTGSGELGTFRADHMRVDLAARTVQLDGGVRLHIPHPRAR